MKRSIVCALVIGTALMAPGVPGASAHAFDPEYRSFAEVLKTHVRFPPSLNDIQR